MVVCIPRLPGEGGRSPAPQHPRGPLWGGHGLHEEEACDAAAPPWRRGVPPRGSQPGRDGRVAQQHQQVCWYVHPLAHCIVYNNLSNPGVTKSNIFTFLHSVCIDWKQVGINCNLIDLKSPCSLEQCFSSDAWVKLASTVHYRLYKTQVTTHFGIPFV